MARLKGPDPVQRAVDRTMLPDPCHCAAGVETIGDEIVAARQRVRGVPAALPRRAALLGQRLCMRPDVPPLAALDVLPRYTVVGALVFAVRRLAFQEHLDRLGFASKAMNERGELGSGDLEARAEFLWSDALGDAFIGHPQHRVVEIVVGRDIDESGDAEVA